MPRTKVCPRLRGTRARHQCDRGAARPFFCVQSTRRAHPRACAALSWQQSKTRVHSDVSCHLRGSSGRQLPPTLAACPAGIDSGASAGTRMTGAVVVAGRLGSDYLAVRLIRSVGRGPNVVPPLPQSWRTRCVDRSARRLDECRSASVSSAPYLIFSIESGGSTAMSFRAMRAATLAGVEAGRMRPGEERAGRVVRRVGNAAASAKSTGSRHRQ